MNYGKTVRGRILLPDELIDRDKSKRLLDMADFSYKIASEFCQRWFA